MIDELYDALYGELNGWCASMTGSRTLAEDLIQEAFLRALMNAELLENLDFSRRRALSLINISEPTRHLRVSYAVL
ncbi:MAG: hypothetical protein K2P71_03215, partial [Lachnospiraceae bacterium]|nr:hypothetical protein [Lachnospiraceae bacterium]